MSHHCCISSAAFIMLLFALLGLGKHFIPPVFIPAQNAMHRQWLWCYVIGPLNWGGTEGPENGIALITSAHNLNMYANV